MEVENIIRALEQGKLSDAKDGIGEVLLGKIANSLEEKRETLGDTLVTPTDVHEGDKAEYEAFFRKALKKFGVDSPADFDSDEEKKKFFDYIEKNYTGEKNEESQNEVAGVLAKGAAVAAKVGAKVGAKAAKVGAKVAKKAVKGAIKSTKKTVKGAAKEVVKGAEKRVGKELAKRADAPKKKKVTK